MANSLSLLSFRGSRPPAGYKDATVTWSGIQTNLEQASSDVLIWLDCCYGGRAHFGEGNGVTELMAACDYESTANGVGDFSFTHNLIIELRRFAKAGEPFNTAQLWERMYHRMQSHVAQEVENERYPAPVHFILTRDPVFHRSIELAPLMDPLSGHWEAVQPVVPSGSRGGPVTSHRRKHPETDSLPGKRACGDMRQPIIRTSRDTGPSTSRAPSPTNTDPFPMVHNFHHDRVIVFAVRLEETMSTEKLSLRAFEDWFRTLPAAVREVGCTLEAVFPCDSTMAVFSVPLAVWTCLENDPAVVCLGPARSSNLLSSALRLDVGSAASSMTQSAAKQDDARVLPIRAKKTVSFAEEALELVVSRDQSGQDSDQDDHSTTDLSAVELCNESPRKAEELTNFDVDDPASTYIKNVADKYPNAGKELVERLGRANWARHVMLRDPDDSFTVPEPSDFRPASVRDSGLGSSIERSMDYEPSLASSLASKRSEPDANHFRVPPMPKSQPWAKAFTCPYCHKSLDATLNRRGWK